MSSFKRRINKSTTMCYMLRLKEIRKRNGLFKIEKLEMLKGVSASFLAPQIEILPGF